MQTKLVRINLVVAAGLTAAPDGRTGLEKQMDDECLAQSAGGFRLVSTFVHQQDLILVFQKP